MTILDAITSSPINVLFTIVIGIGLAYLYCRKPSSSSSSASAGAQSASANHHRHFPPNAFLHTHPATVRGAFGVDPSLGVVDEELQRSLALIERQERDMIRQEQDAAYQQSLKADREKRLKKEREQHEREAKEKAERDEREQLARLHQRLTQLRSEIRDKLPKPAKSGADEIVKLVFKLPDGTRVKQEFCKHDRVKYLHWFVFSLENAPLQFRMTTNFPKRELPGRPPLPEDFLQEELERETSSLSIDATTMNNDSSSKPSSSLSLSRSPSSPVSSDSAKSTTMAAAGPTTPTTTTTNTTTLSNGNKAVEPNCELTLIEAGLTETQIIFVYDLEA